MKKIGIALLIVGIGLAGWIYFNQQEDSLGGVVAITRIVNKPIGYSEYYNLFPSATTTSATSSDSVTGDGVVKVAGAKKVMVFFSRGGATGPNTGNTRFKIQGTPDGTNWYDYSKLVLATSTSETTQSVVNIAASTSTVAASLKNQFDTWQLIRCVVVETTDGDHQCLVYVEY